MSTQALTKGAPYQEVLQQKGEKYLRGWVRADAVLDPPGYSRRLANFERYNQSNKNK